MLPADERLAYVLGTRAPAAGTDLETFVREWLADPPDPLPDTGPLRRGLAALAPRQRAAVVLRYWSGLSVAAVAELLDCPQQTVEWETDAAFDVLATDEQRLRADLAALAEQTPVAPPAPRRRWRSAGVAAGVLVAAGVFAAVLGLDGPAHAPRADPTPVTTPRLVVVDPVNSVDDRARRLTAELAAMRSRLFPAGVELGPAWVQAPGGRVQWAPLEFHVDHTPDLYLAVATVGTGRDAATLKIDVGYRNPAADPPFTPCPKFQRACVSRRFPDGTTGAVTVFTEPSTDQTIHRLTAMRPDGTFCHVTVFYREPRPDAPPLGVAALLGFATALRY